MSNRRHRDTLETSKIRLEQDGMNDSPLSARDSEAILRLTNAFDKQNGEIDLPAKQDLAGDLSGVKKPKHKSPASNNTQLTTLKTLASEIELTDPDRTASDLNTAITNLRHGNGETMTDSYALSSCRNFQHMARTFYRVYASDSEQWGEPTNVDPDRITVFERESGSSFDERDMLTRQEISDAFAAAGNARDRAVMALLLYTGMRNTAARMVRLKDIDLESGDYYFNQDEPGLKDIYKISEPRTLLLSKQYIREWLRDHPAYRGPNDYDRDAYLITGKPGYSTVDPFEPVAPSTLSRAMNQIKDKSGIQKPMNPHMMRHNYVTILKRDYELPDDTIKFLIGHSPSSTVMETTYAHLSSSDHNGRADVAAGIREATPEESANSFTPDICVVCDNLPDPGDRFCGHCGEPFAPDAEKAAEKAERDMYDSKGSGSDADDDTLDAMRDMIDDPDVMADMVSEAIKNNPDLLRDALSNDD